MFTRFYSDGDPASDKSNPAITDDKKTPDLNNTDPGKGKPEDTDKGKSDTNTDTTDYKAKLEESEKGRLAAENQFKEYQRGTTPKLERLAEIDKVQQTKADENDPIIRIDKQIDRNKQEIVRYKAEGIDTTALETGVLTLENQRNQIVSDRQKQTADDRMGNFALKHAEFTDYAALTKIIVEAKKSGEDMGWNGAYAIWSKDQEIAKMKESAAIDADSKDLGEKALGQDGKPLPDTDKGEGRKADQEFYVGMFGKEKATKMLGSKK